MDFLACEGKNYIIYYHVRPDGDCIGSAYALGHYLQSIGNRVLILGQDEVPHVFDYLTENFCNDFSENDIPENCIRITVDSAAPKRIGRFGGEDIDICIDHHIGNEISADIKIIDEDAPACTEIIFGLLKDKLSDNPRARVISTLLYLGLITDTNAFRNEDVRAATFMTAAELKELGADSYTISQKHSFIKPKAQVEMENRLINSYDIIDELGIVSGMLTQKDADEIGAGVCAFEKICSKPMEMEGTKIAIVVRELPDGRCRASVRTRGELNAYDICRKYGGGGHKNAAGCTLDMRPDDIRKLFVNAAISYLRSITA